jgi:hypothetical protein
MHTIADQASSYHTDSRGLPITWHGGTTGGDVRHVLGEGAPSPQQAAAIQGQLRQAYDYVFGH